MGDAPPEASASPGTSASEAATTGAEARSVSDDDSVEKPIDPEVLDKPIDPEVLDCLVDLEKPIDSEVIDCLVDLDSRKAD